MTESVNNTTIPPAASITDAAGVVWTVVAGQAYRNGTVDSVTHSIDLLLYWLHVVFQHTTTPGWWYWDGTVWVGTADPRINTGLSSNALLTTEFQDGQVPGSITPSDMRDLIAAMSQRQLVIAASDEVTNLTVGTAVTTFRMAAALTLSSVRLSVNTAPVGSALIVDVKKNGTSIFSTKPTIAAGSTTSVKGTVPVLSTTALTEDDQISIDINQVGSTTPGKGLKVTLLGARA